MTARMLLARRAFAAIERDCLEHACVETGGLLVGRRLGRDTLAVAFTVLAGPRARRMAHRFAPDSAWQQAFLDYLVERFHALDYIGDWHKHPAGMAEPSAHDHATARRIVTDAEWNKVEALFPIALVADGKVCLRAYLMTRDATDFKEISIVVVEDADARMRQLLLGPSPKRLRRQ